MARKIDYANLNADDLQYIADRQWLAVEGDYQGFKTTETLNRWRETGEVPDFDTDGDAGEDEGIEYKDASLKDLQAEAERRELPKSGTKQDIIDRLEAYDAEHEGEEEEEEEEDDAEA